MVKNKITRVFAVLLSIILVGSNTEYVSHAEEVVSTSEDTDDKSVTWQEAHEEYSEILSIYSKGVSDFKSSSEKNILIDINTEYTDLVKMLSSVESSLSAEVDNMDYTKINATYVYAMTTLQDNINSFSNKVEKIRSNYPSDTDNYNKLYDEESVIRVLSSMVRNTIGVKLNSFIKKYEGNKEYSDEISVMLELEGGTYNKQFEVTYKGYTGNSVILSEPERQGYKFKGWEVVVGDCTYSYKNYSYVITYGTKNSVLKAVWESDGSVVETQAPTQEPETTPEVTKEPVVRNISVYIDLDGCYYNGTDKIEKKVQENTTVVLFDNVNVLQKEGYKIDSIDCKYGKCVINPEGKVLYTAPSYSTSNLDTVKVNWVESNNPTDDNKNIVNVNLKGGTFISTGKEFDTIITNVNETSILFNISDIKRDGYKLKSFECTDTENSKVVIQDGKVILINSAFVKGGITLNAVWESNSDVTPNPTQTPSITGTPVYNSPTPNPTQTPAVTEEPVKITATPTIKPTTKPSEIKLTLDRNSVILGKNEKVKIDGKVSAGKTIVWESEDTKIATVDNKGNIIARGIGSTIVTAKVGTVKRKVNVVVYLAPVKLGLNKSLVTKANWTLKKGKSKQIRLYFTKGSYSNKIVFKSSNKKVATVTSGGLVRAKKKGKVKITAKTFNGKKATIKLVVK